MQYFQCFEVIQKYSEYVTFFVNKLITFELKCHVIHIQ